MQRTSLFDGNRLLIKGLLIASLILIMLIPGIFIQNLVKERQSRQEEVVSEVSNKWAGRQTITGPLLMVPYKEIVKTNDGKTLERTNMLYLLPDELHIAGNLQPTEKKRSLYSVLLYRSDIRLTGKFNPLPLQQLQIPPESVMWQDARFVVNIEDVRGIEDQVQLDWNGSKQYLDAGLPANNFLKEGLSTPINISAQSAGTFALTISLRGSDNLYFTPVGKTTDADLTAGWKNPSFDGQYLPATSEVTDKSFKAHWKILPLSRTYPQYWINSSQDLGKAAFGVRLIQPVDGYAKTNRSVKYAILFVSLTYLFFFFLEMMQKKQIHPFQYILVGFALSIFYALLLSISEYTGFNVAYLIASAATISLIGLYAWSMFKSGKTALGFTAALTMLYVYIFVLIQLEDYALLCGSIGLFIIIAIVMYYSRKVDWYSIGRHAEDKDADEDIQQALPQ